jgi:peptide/nickel transport system ATP-binding protein
MSQQPDTRKDGRVLEVDRLRVSIGNGLVAVRSVSFEVRRGESVGLVGESGSGKTLTCRAILGLLPETGEVDSGSILLGVGGSAVELTKARRATWNRVRGRRIAAVFQDPGSYLNPSLTIGHQIGEQLRVGGGLTRPEARARALELLTEVEIHDAANVYHRYPFELSGGMLQRINIAIGISLNPELLVADEATSSLDTVVQGEILDLLRRLRHSHHLALILVTHDLAVVAETCERVVVMYAGEVVESGRTQQVLADPQHPYTRALLSVASIGDWSRRQLPTIPGQLPAAGEELPGCRFSPRCRHSEPRCLEAPPPLAVINQDRVARCIRIGEFQHG